MTRATYVISCDAMHTTQNTKESKKIHTILPVTYVKRVSQKHAYSIPHKYLQHAVNHFTRRTGSKSPTPNTV